MVDGCSVKHVGTLDVHSGLGHAFSCATAREKAILLCFPKGNQDKCYLGATPFSRFSKITASHYGHENTYVSASNDHLFVVGSTSGSGSNGLNHKRVELLDLASGLELDEWKWTKSMDYPFAHHLSLAPTLAHSDGSFYHFGGMMRLNSQEELKTTSPFIASYSPITDQWTMRGELKTARSASSVIWTESAFLVLGGGLHGSISPGPNLPEKGEKCEFNDSNQIVCTLQDFESTSK